MGTAPSAVRIERTYCSEEDVMELLGPKVIGKGSDGRIKPERVTYWRKSFSRQLDGILSSNGWRTPFPPHDAASGGIDTPEPVRQWVARMSAYMIATLSNFGNRNARLPVALRKLAEEILKVEPETGELLGTLPYDAFEEYSQKEEYQHAIGDEGREWGRIAGTNNYRLRNPGLLIASHRLVFVDANDKETYRAAGTPFTPGVDWSVVNQDEGIINLANQAAIVAAAPYVSYWWTWRPVGYLCPIESGYEGVSTFQLP